jgi:hypothetical protein
MTDQFPDPKLTPSPKQLQEWVDLLPQGSVKAFTAAAQWGANQELKSCCDWLSDEILCESNTHRKLRAARRPKPPSLNSIALQMLGTIERDAHYIPEITDTIRRALEALPND